MILFFLSLLPFRKPDESTQFKQMLGANYPFLQRTCSLVVRWHGNAMDDVAESEAEYLLGRVLDHFMEDDYRRLRSREIRNIKTFFRDCIENLFKDILAERHGKDRSKERARDLGETGLKIWSLMRSGHTLDVIYSIMQEHAGEVHSWEDIHTMVQRIKGSNVLPPTDSNRVVQVVVEEGDEPDPTAFDVRDDRPNPEEMLSEHRKYELRRKVLADLDGMLDDEERVIIRLYYLEQGENKCTVNDIAQYLGKTPKAADHKLRRILADFREYMFRKGLRPDDIL
jgi:RNA polymerase sigma factor (sigma-70 family)